MIKEQVTVEDKGKHEVRVTVSATQDATPQAMLAQWLRSLPPNQRKFFKECRIVSVLPVYAPTGMFDSNEATIHLDPDQLDHFVDNAPQFRAVDDTRNNTTLTGSKLISMGMLN